MPQIFKIGSYWIYFWSNENDPVEPIHVHVAKGKPISNATKIWITSSGNCYLANNKSNIPQTTLKNIMRIIETQSDDIIKKWKEFFGEVHFYF